MQTQSSTRSPKSSLILFLIILAVGILYFFTNLYYTPGRWGDEGANLNIAYNLLHGKLQFFSFDYPFVPHPPLFFILSLPGLAIFGKSIVVLRVISACFGLISVYLFYKISYEIFKSHDLSIISALVFGGSQTTLLFARLGMTYSMLVACFLLIALFLVRHNQHHEPKNLKWAAIVAAITSLTSFIGLSFVLLVIIYSFVRQRETFWKILCISTLPFITYLAIFLVINPKSMIYDLAVSLGRVEDRTSAVPINEYFAKLISKSLFATVGFIGLWLFPKKYRPLAITSFVFICAVEYRFDKMILSNVVLALGVLALIWDVNLRTKSIERPILGIPFPKIRPLLLALLIVLFGVYPPAKNISLILGKKQLGTNEEGWFSPENINDTKAVADFVNKNTESDDIVMASTSISSMIDSQTIDPILATIYKGYPTVNFANNFPKQRFIYNSSLENVKFAIVDKFTKNWHAFQPNVREQVLEKFWNYWPVAFRVGDTTVYRNPSSIVVGSKTDPISQTIFRYDTTETLSLLNYTLGLEELKIYKDNLKPGELDQIKKTYSIKSESEKSLKVKAGARIEKAYISQKPIALHSGNDRMFFDNAKKNSLDLQKNLIVDFSVNGPNLNLAPDKVARLGNLFTPNSSMEDFSTALTLEQAKAQEIVMEPNQTWFVSPDFKQAYGETALSTLGVGYLNSSFNVKEDGDYSVYVRTFETNEGSAIAFSLDDKQFSPNIISKNSSQGFHFKKVFEGPLGTGFHTLSFFNSENKPSSIDQVYLIKKEDFEDKYLSVVKQLRQAPIKTDDYKSLDIKQDDIRYSYQEDRLGKINLEYSSNRPVVVALPKPFDARLFAQDQDGNRYSSIEVNGQYQGFIVEKTGQVKLKINLPIMP